MGLLFSVGAHCKIRAQFYFVSIRACAWISLEDKSLIILGFTTTLILGGIWIQILKYYNSYTNHSVKLRRCLTHQLTEIQAWQKELRKLNLQDESPVDGFSEAEIFRAEPPCLTKRVEARKKGEDWTFQLSSEKGAEEPR